MNIKLTSPVYKRIALDLANRIYHGDFDEGEKIHGRSTLAGEYNVSPETIRRSIKLLEDMGVVEVSQGSGIIVISKEKAGIFINRFNDMESIGILKDEIETLIQRKIELDNMLNSAVEKVIDYSNRFRNVNPINTIEIKVPSDCEILGKTVSESKFWQNTGGTIVGIRRYGEIIISPGPYAVFQEDDILLIVGEDKVIESVNKFLKENKKK